MVIGCEKPGPCSSPLLDHCLYDASSCEGIEISQQCVISCRAPYLGISTTAFCENPGGKFGLQYTEPSCELDFCADPEPPPGYWIEKCSPNRLLWAAAGMRLLLILVAEVQDLMAEVPYTDIDYQVFSDAAESVWLGESPYANRTALLNADATRYRYTPLLAYILVPNRWMKCWGKLLFSALDLVVGCFLQTCGSLRLALWLFNPFCFTISTRGSGESVIAVLIHAMIYFLEKEMLGLGQLLRRVSVAAVLFGLAVHWRIYPVIYVPAIAVRLSHRDFLGFAVLSLSTFMVLVAFFYKLYGMEFLQCAYLHHSQRKDPQHNFSAPAPTCAHDVSRATTARLSGCKPILRPCHLPDLDCRYDLSNCSILPGESCEVRCSPPFAGKPKTALYLVRRNQDLLLTLPYCDLEGCPDPDPIPPGYKRVGESFTCVDGFVGQAITQCRESAACKYTLSLSGCTNATEMFVSLTQLREAPAQRDFSLCPTAEACGEPNEIPEGYDKFLGEWRCGTAAIGCSPRRNCQSTATLSGCVPIEPCLPIIPGPEDCDLNVSACQSDPPYRGASTIATCPEGNINTSQVLTWTRPKCELTNCIQRVDIPDGYVKERVQTVLLLCFF
eukprot:g23828.t1